MALAVVVQCCLCFVEVVAHGAREPLTQPMCVEVLLKELLGEEQSRTLLAGEPDLTVHALHMPCQLITEHKLFVALRALMGVHSCVCHPVPCEPRVAKALEVTVIAFEKPQQRKRSVLCIDRVPIMCQGYVTLQLSLSG